MRGSVGPELPQVRRQVNALGLPGASVKVRGGSRQMRWRTFNRLLAQAQQLEGRADMMFAARWMARFGMLSDKLS